MHPRQLKDPEKRIEVQWAGQEAGIRRKASELERLLNEISKRAALAEDEVTAVDRLTDELTNAKKRNTSLATALYEARDEVRQLRSAIVKRESDSSLQQQWEKMMRQTADLENDLEGTKYTLSVAHDEVHELEEERKVLQDQIETLSDQAQQYFQRAECLQLQLEHKERSAEQLRDFLSEQSLRQVAGKERVNQYILKLEHQLQEAKRNGFVDEEECNGERRNPFLSDELSAPVFPMIDATAKTRFDPPELVKQPTQQIVSAQQSIPDQDCLAGTEAMQPKEQMTLWDNDISVVLLLVFQHLDIQTLVRVSAVCRQWREVSRQPSLWKHVHLGTDSVHSDVLSHLSAFCSETQSLYLENLGYVLEPASSGEEMHSYHKRMIGCYESGLKQFLSNSSMHIREIKIKNCNIVFTERSLWIVSCHCPQLTDFEYTSECFPASEKSLWCLAQGCPKIKALRVPPICYSETASKFNDLCLSAISRGWPHLRTVGIGGPSLTLPGLLRLCSGCPRLQHIELDRMCALSEAAVAKMCHSGLKGLERLDITFTRVSATALKYLVGACPRLQFISMHIGISDYFQDINDRTNKEQFKEKMDELKRLAYDGPLYGILQVRDDYG